VRVVSREALTVGAKRGLCSGEVELPLSLHVILKDTELTRLLEATSEVGRLITK
jgi:hypothetical protein